MAPEAYQHFRATAPMHVQLWRTGHDPRPGRLTGRIVRIFRDADHRLYWGQRVSFHVPMADRSAGPPMPSGTIHHHGDHLAQARWFEAFLEWSDGGVHLVHSQILVILRPTLRPVCADIPGFLCTDPRLDRRPGERHGA